MATTSYSNYISYGTGDVLILARTISNTIVTYDKFQYNPEMTISALTTDNVIPFNDVTTARIIIIEANMAVQIKQDDVANTAVECDHMYFVTTSATALYVSNLNSVDATIKVVILGV